MRIGRIVDVSKKKQSSKRRRQRQPRPSRRDWLKIVGTWITTGMSIIATGMSILSYRRQADQLVPQRQAVELSGVTHHRVDAVGISVSVRVSQPVVTVVRVPVVWRA